MAKKLKLYSGGRVYAGGYRGCHFYVAAYSFQHCVDLLNEATNTHNKVSDLDNYWTKDCLGNIMQVTEEPCVYYTKNSSDKEPKRLL